MDLLRTISPVDGSVVAELPLATREQLRNVIARARTAQRAWGGLTIVQRAEHCARFVDAVVTLRDEISRELTLQMGRPISQTPSELRGFEERARFMIAEAESALRPVQAAPHQGVLRFIQRDPLGVVLTLSPWNYPLLTAVNTIVPALMAGNTVVLKPSAQTPLAAERLLEAWRAAGLPDEVFQIVHCSHEETRHMIEHPDVDFVAFTGSVDGGHAVQRAAAGRFIGTGLELGGKDPAYVRPDVDLTHAVANLVDGAFFNSGQSCCGIERIYVHQDRFHAFLEAFVEQVKAYRLGDPLQSDVNLGPVVRTAAAEFVREQVAEAVAQGATAHIDPATFDADQAGTPYLAPQVLTGVNHEMRVMREESFGPVVGIMPVQDDDQAVQLMNDSEFGLTASVWTLDKSVAISLGQRVQCGTWFMNRCDYLDPALAWTGVKDSGRGCTLSRVGYESLTHPKSFHLRFDT